MAAGYLTPALFGSRPSDTRPSPFAGTSKAEANKHKKYVRCPVATLNPPLASVAIALTDFGGIHCSGLELDTTVARPHFNGLREMEEVAGGSDARRRKRKSELRQSQLPPTTAPS